MRIISHFPSVGTSNSYVVGPNEGGAAILVDPGKINVNLIVGIEDSQFHITTVLITHSHANHISGLRTLLKIYDAEIVAGSGHVMNFEARAVTEGMTLELSGMRVDVLEVEGHSADSRVYRIGPYLFTGDTLSAGRVGSASSSANRKILVQSIRQKILRLCEHTLILPGHGPPTTVFAEKTWNTDLAPITQFNQEDPQATSCRADP